MSDQLSQVQFLRAPYQDLFLPGKLCRERDVSTNKNGRIFFGFILTARVLLLSLLFLLSGCAQWQKRDHVELGQIYNDLAQLPDNQRNPVIVVPGIMGSRLVDIENERVVWGNLGLVVDNPQRKQNLRSLALPMKAGAPLHELHDSTREDGPLDKMTVKLLGIPIKINAYAQILASLGVGGYRDEHFQGSAEMNEIDYGDDHFTCFQFSYDWRRDISETAAELDKFIERSEQLIRQQYKERYGIENAEIKFDIVAHSMGGLVTRYYLRYGNQRLPENGAMPDLNWAGANHVERVVLVGTPNAGSTQSITELVKGMQISQALRRFPATAVGTMPAAYQLLPRTRHLPLVTKDGESIDVYAAENWQRFEWGLADPGQDRDLRKLLPGIDDFETRRMIALEHQRKCLTRAKQFHESLDRTAMPPSWLQFHLFAGDAKPTLHRIVVDGRTGKFLKKENEAGDGLVTRKSAVLLEAGDIRPFDAIPWSNKTFISSDHIGLTRDRAFVDNVLSLLLEQGEAKYHETTNFHNGR